MGKYKILLFGLGAAVSSAVMAQVTGACPGLLANLPTILIATLTATVGGLTTYLMRRPLQNAGGKALATGAITAAVAAFAATLVPQIEVVCGQGFVKHLPQLAVAGVWVGLGLWFRAPHESGK